MNFFCFPLEGAPRYEDSIFYYGSRFGLRGQLCERERR